MKHILILLFSFTTFSCADLSVKQIQEMVNKIHEKREGIKLETLENTKEPFVRLEENNSTSTFVIPTKKIVEEAKLILHAIVNEKAYINDRWMSEGESILGYNLKYIGNRGAVLRNDNHIKKLFLRKKRNNFITIEER